MKLKFLNIYESTKLKKNCAKRFSLSINNQKQLNKQLIRFAFHGVYATQDILLILRFIYMTYSNIHAAGVVLCMYVCMCIQQQNNKNTLNSFNSVEAAK